jgi:hypothetical protein
MYHKAAQRTLTSPAWRLSCFDQTWEITHHAFLCWIGGEGVAVKHLDYSSSSMGRQIWLMVIEIGQRE